jgi:hypothetical protein
MHIIAYKALCFAGKSAVVGAAWLAAVTIDESTLMPLGSAVFVLSGVWYLSSRLQRMEDGLKEANRRLKVLEDR